MAHSDDATKAWVSSTPTKNADGNVIKWNCKYKYTLAVSGKADYVHTFDKFVFLAFANQFEVELHDCGDFY